jgi:c-di-GMP-binding flagellar brake protein YcgR
MPPRKNARRVERRRAPRVDARLSMRVEGGHDEADGAQIVTESQNISASGVYCESSRFLAPASKVALTIVLPRVPGGRAAKELIKCEGIVVRCEPTGTKRSERHYQLACMFSALDEQRRRQIEDFVTWRNLQSLRAAAEGVAPARRRAARRATTTPKRAARPARGAARRPTVH